MCINLCLYFIPIEQKVLDAINILYVPKKSFEWSFEVSDTRIKYIWLARVKYVVT